MKRVTLYHLIGRGMLCLFLAALVIFVVWALAVNMQFRGALIVFGGAILFIGYVLLAIWLTDYDTIEEGPYDTSDQC